MTDLASRPKLQLLPAIDMIDGKAVQLTQGEVGTETHYGSPVDAAMNWIDQGAEWIHLVDLDAAFGRGSNVAVARKIVARVGNRIKIELSGGIRDDKSLETALEMGVNRVNIGTAALENPEWTRGIIARHGEQIAVGLDVRGETLSGRGWTKEGGNIWDVFEALEDAGCPRYVVTDVDKDGMLRGPNIDLLREVCSRTDRPVIASGGVSSLDDLAALRDIVPHGLEGAIIGRALYDGAFTLPAALDVAGQ